MIKNMVGIMLALTTAACSSSDHTQPTGSGASMTAAIGASGGALTVEGTTISVPAGSLTAMTMVTITSTTTAAPASISAWSPVYKFAPDGLTFPIPATVKLTPGAGAPAGLAIFWSNASGGYDPLTTTAAGGAFQATVTHFSSGFLGTMTSSTTPTTCSAPACGALPGCSSSCSGAMPFAVCVQGSVDKMGSCSGSPPTCNCVANDPGHTCSTAASTVCGAGCTKTCTDPTPYAICIEANLMKVMGGGDTCAGPASCSCSASPQDMAIGGGGDGGGGK